ncbi:MAG TPA: hypothetical protein VGG06_10275 [Thermoanaerobaculia bacterium]
MLKTKKPVVSIAVFLTGGPKGIEVREVKIGAAGWTSLRFFYLAFGLSGSLAEDYVDRPQPLAAGSERFTAELKRDANKEARGRLEATRKAIVLLARRRHREVPLDFEETLRAIDDLDRLYRILERVVDAPSIAELDLG